MLSKRSLLITIISFVLIPPVSAQLVFTETDITSQVPSIIEHESWTVSDPAQSDAMIAITEINGANQTWDFTTLIWPRGTRVGSKADFICTVCGPARTVKQVGWSC